MLVNSLEMTIDHQLRVYLHCVVAAGRRWRRRVVCTRKLQQQQQPLTWRCYLEATDSSSMHTCLPAASRVVMTTNRCSSRLSRICWTQSLGHRTRASLTTTVRRTPICPTSPPSVRPSVVWLTTLDRLPPIRSLSLSLSLSVIYDIPVAELFFSLSNTILGF